MTDTPKTDALVTQWDGWSLGDAGSIFVEFARELERENSAVLKALAYAINQADAWHDNSHGGKIESPEMDKARSLIATPTPTPPP